MILRILFHLITALLSTCTCPRRLIQHFIPSQHFPSSSNTFLFSPSAYTFVSIASYLNNSIPTVVTDQTAQLFDNLLALTKSAQFPPPPHLYPFNHATRKMTAPIDLPPSSHKRMELSTPVKFSLITSSPALVAVLAANIQKHVSCTDALPRASFEHMTIFHALEPPAISVCDYVKRVAKYVFCSDACLVAAYHYMRTAVQKDPRLALSSLSFHRLFITSVVLACKYFDDVSYNLLYYAKVGGLPCKELVNLEMHLLRILDFRLSITDRKFISVENEMINSVTDLAPKPLDNILPPLLTKARMELARVQPVELPRPCDDVNFDQLVAEKERQRRQCVRKPRFNTDSAHSPSTSTMSRNSSLASVSQVELMGCDEYGEKPVVRVCKGDKRIADSPVSPAEEYEESRAPREVSG